MTSYYQGLSYLKLNDHAHATEIFNAMIEEANRQLNTEVSNVGLKFESLEARKARQSRYQTIRGLGYKGKGENSRAKSELKSAVELSHSNLWAKAEFEGM